MTDPKAFVADEQRKLGANGGQRMRAAQAWVKTANISAAERSELEVLTVTAGGVAAIERLMGQTGSAKSFAEALYGKR